ncbi:ethylbenzene dehydrogenase-related protein [Pseudoalteromonas sp. T1lg23B]|uniref:ethylbenzene dehydrogenase-related protein n=1 Tax=Pseudoalteromonas sp. T1lg23B TaxID=2077097 RepID=UPI001F4792C0|nr:ethylbenzene dehydrogenase-related protein [Pseudoalteromonas sp. T1lg23B]
MRRSIFILLHTAAIFAITLSLLSGFRIATLTKPYLLTIAALLPSGQVHNLHLLSASLLLSLSVYYLYFRMSIGRVTSQSRYHRVVTWLGHVSLTICLISGLLNYFDLTPEHIVSLHYYSAVAIVAYLLLHSWVYIMQFGCKAFKKILLMSSKHVPYKLLAALSLCTGVLFFFINSLTHTLNITPISTQVLMEIDGLANEPQWQNAHTFIIDTANGANFANGHTQVQIKALSNQHETFFLFRWADPTKSLQHLPLTKTSQGWKVKENGFYLFDEQSYYEDKFAVMLSNSCDIGADGTSHLGKKPFADKPANWHGKGYHASLDGKVRDLWHWKAVRTNDMVLADDNYIGPLAEPLSGQRRYKAGYQTDGKESGAYVMNWQWYSPSSITPKRLPTHSGNDDKPVLPWFGSQPYHQSKDIYPIGTHLSSVLYRSNRFEGDRADVRAKGHWHDGFWTLELVRQNQTQSKYDVALNNDTCIWVSAFDSSQIAHTRHQRAIKLRYSL